MKKVKLIKSFEHDGKTYNIGDEFEGMPDEIADLVRQGYCKDPDAPEAEEES
jgi:hypothetical protein